MAPNTTNSLGIQKPFRRNVRAFIDGEYSKSGSWMYIIHKKYAPFRENYIRAYLLIQKDLQELFDYVEPSDQNLQTYSYRIHALLMRVCIEVESNFKAILADNTYSKSSKDLNIDDYRLVNQTHRLSSYEVIIPGWYGTQASRKPFLSWDKEAPLYWYKVYNATKHNRGLKFHEATLEMLLDAVAGLVVLLASQFQDNDDVSGEGYLLTDVLPGDGTARTIGGFFRIKYPTDWPKSEAYNFEWQKLQDISNPFAKINYDKIAKDKNEH